MKHFDYRPLYEEILARQKNELIDVLRKYPNHEFHFGMDYAGSEQKKNAEYPYVLGYLGEEAADLKVLAVREKNGSLSILAKDEQDGYEGTITDVRLDVVLGQLENILDEMPDM